MNNEISPASIIDVLVEYSKKIQSSWVPLLHLGIIEFRYARSFNNLTQFSIGSNVPWVENYYHHEFHKMGSFNRHPAHYKSGVVLWGDIGDYRPFIYARDHHNIGKGITIVEKRTDGCEFYFFGGSVDNSNITSFLVSHIELLKRYIAFFKSENNDFIQKGRQFNLPLYLPENDTEDEQALKAQVQENIDNFLNATKPQNLYLHSNGHEVVLTKAESKCIALLLEGKTANETAEMLFISRRTIEKHLEHIREKLNCHNKLQLMTLLAKYAHIL